jgi:XTP/dITP diphosphohydrolase
MLTLLIASSNHGKISEIKDFLEGLEINAIGLSDLAAAYAVPEETGSTFEENAIIKAEYYFNKTGLLTLADDSGLEVDAIDGRPGVCSARYGGSGISSTGQINLLLGELRDVPEARRTARFICAIALIGPNVRRIFEGRCEGRITSEPRGDKGFGYDPIFLAPESGKSFAELEREEKTALSHRGMALRKCRNYLNDLSLKT